MTVSMFPSQPTIAHMHHNPDQVVQRYSRRRVRFYKGCTPFVSLNLMLSRPAISKSVASGTLNSKQVLTGAIEQLNMPWRLSRMQEQSWVSWQKTV